MNEKDISVLEDVIFQIEYLLEQGNCPNGLVSVCAGRDDAKALKRILAHLQGVDKIMSRKECLWVVENFNSLCPSLPAVRTLTEARMKALGAAKKLLGGVSFAELFRRAEASDFISGRSGKWKGASFDWVLKKANLVKILEGNYDNGREAKAKESSFDMDEFWDAAMRRSEKLLNACTGGE